MAVVEHTDIASGESLQVRLLSRLLRREAHVLAADPCTLAGHLHNMLHLENAPASVAEPLLARACAGASSRPWLRLTNRPTVDRPSLIGALSVGTSVNGIAWAPDGRMLATVTSDHRLGIWDTTEGREIRSIERVLGPIGAVDWSPTGRVLAVGGDDGTIRLWDPTSEAVTTLPTTHQGSVRVAWSPDGATLASYGQDGTVCLVDPATRTTRTGRGRHTGTVFSLAWSPDGLTLASAGRDGTIRLWDASTGEMRASWEPHRLSAGGIPDRMREFIRAGLVGKAWDEGGPLGRRVAEEWQQGIGLQPVFAVAWSRRGDRLAASGMAFADGTFAHSAHVWDIASNAPRLVAEWATGQRALVALGWSPDDAVIASGSDDGSVRFWDPAGEPRGALEGHTHPVMNLSWSPGGAVLASGGFEGMVRLWDVTIAPSNAAARGHPDTVRDVTWSPDGTAYASVSNFDRAVRLWNGNTGESLHTVDLGDIPVIAFAPDGVSFAAANDADGTLMVVDPNGASRLARHTEVVLALAWSPVEPFRLASASANPENPTVRVWDPATKYPHPILRGHTNRVRTVVWSPDGTRVASGGEDNTVRVWDVESGEQLALLEGHTEWILALAWSNDGALIASASRDGTVRLWDPMTGELVAVLEGHTHMVEGVAFSPDSALVASGGFDDTVRVWSIDDAACIATARTFSAGYGIQFGDDNRTLRVADNGMSTANKPLPYVFALERFDSAAGADPRSAEPESFISDDAEIADLESLLSRTGLRYETLDDGSVLVRFAGQNGEDVEVEADILDDGLAFFSVDLPTPEPDVHPVILRHLLCVSFLAYYAKAFPLDSGELRLSCELPVSLVTPQVCEALIRSLAVLGDIAAPDLPDWEGWQQRLNEAEGVLTQFIALDAGETLEEIARLANDAAVEVQPREPSGPLVLEWDHAGWGLKVTVQVRQQAITLLTSLRGVRPADDDSGHLSRLLDLNEKHDVIRVGRVADGDVALAYEVPAMYPGLLKDAMGRIDALLDDVLEMT